MKFVREDLAEDLIGEPHGASSVDLRLIDTWDRGGGDIWGIV